MVRTEGGAGGCLRRMGLGWGNCVERKCVDPSGSLCSHLNYVVSMGEINLSSKNAVNIPVQDIIVHQDYSVMGSIVNDIALALLAFPVNYTVSIQPVCLPDRAFLVQAGTQCWVTGWGRTFEKGEPKQRPQQLQTREQTAS